MKTEASEYLSLLQEIQNNNVSTFTVMPADEPRFTIETNSRNIIVPSEFSFLSVQNDHRAETIYFEIDRYFDNVDLSQHACVVQFINKSGTTINEGTYPVTSMDIDSVDGKIVFGWEIRNDATQLTGDITFSVRFYSIDNNGNFTYNFNTLTASSYILPSLNIIASGERITATELEVWTDKMNNLASSIESDIITVEEKIEELENYIASIPEDYTALTEEVSQLSSEIGDVKGYVNYHNSIFESRTKNLLDWRNVVLFDGYNDNSKLVASPYFKTIILPVSVPYNTYYRVTRFGELSSRFSVATLRDDPANGVSTYNTQQNNTAESILKTVHPEDKYIAIWFYNANNDGADYLAFIKNMVVTEGLFQPQAYMKPIEPVLKKKIDIISAANTLVRTANLFDCDDPLLFYGMNTGSVLSFGQQCCILLPVSEPAMKSYSVARFGAKGKYFSVATLRDEPADGVTTYNTVQDNEADYLQFYVYPEDKYIVIWFYTSTDTVVMEDIMKGIVVLRRYIPATQFIPYYAPKTALSEKKINFFGDSFTDDNISYEFQLTDRVGCENKHVGKGNSAIVTDASSADSFLTRMAGIDENADITIIFGGINDARDLGSGAITMGTIESPHDTTTFYGGMQLLLDNLIAMAPEQLFLGIIPPSFQPNAPYTTWIPKIQSAEREVYRKYHIPFVDIAWDCFAMSDNPAIMALYRKSVTGTTNYHPNADGHKKICDLIQGKLESIIR